MSDLLIDFMEAINADERGLDVGSVLDLITAQHLKIDNIIYFINHPEEF